MTERTRRRWWVGVMVLFAIPSALIAQQSTDGPYVLHENIQDLELGRPGEGGTQPKVDPNEFFAAGQPPALSLEARPGEPIYDKDGPVFDRPIEAPYGELSPFAGANSLDERTDRVDSLTYFANFDPSIIPYKRVVAKGHAKKMGSDYALEVLPTQRRPVVPTGQLPDGDVDMFWGTFLVRMERGRPHPLASVAPSQEIIEIVSEPDLPLQIERDGADNFFVRSSVEGLVRINLRIAVPKFYFGGDFPSVSWSDFPVGLTPPMDSGLQAHALGIAQRLGFNKSAPPAEVIVEMVRYFRDFEARPFPAERRGDDLLEAISTAAVGVCRHRSLAFVFLAQSMGIPTRYVYNEAHAFVEVFWPVGGWRRLDLGGAANELNASANDGRSVHDPGDDGLPTPDRFLKEQQLMSHNGWEPPASAPGRGGNSAGEPQSSEASTANNAAAQNGTASTNGAAPQTGNDLPPFEAPPPDERALSRLEILTASPVVRRGTSLSIEAVLRSTAGEPLGGRDVEIYLGPVGAREPRAARKIGAGRTNRDGLLRTRVDVPREHAIGRWSLFVFFPGDGKYQPAVAD